MQLRQRVLAGAYYSRAVSKRIAGALGRPSSNRLRVLLYHDIPPANLDNFARQIRWLKRSWRFVSPEKFGSMISGADAIAGSNLLLTFDDGFASNRIVAEKVLRPLGIRAVFFVIPGFVDLVDRGDSQRFIANYIQPGTQINTLPPHLYNMSWGDLEALLEQGHTLGGHTWTHARLSKIHSIEELKGEIVGSADVLQDRLGATIEHFAYTFGDLKSFSQPALALARRRFRFVYSGLRGDNARGISPWALRRDAISARDSRTNLGALVEGAADFWYARSRAELDRWV